MGESVSFSVEGIKTYYIMVTTLSFKNYKAFLEGSLEFKPLTFLVGANSVGKSSLIQLLLMLQQTAVEASDNDRTAFKLNGKNISLGENINIIRNKDKHNQLSLSFILDADSAISMMSGIKAVFFHSLERLFVYSGVTFYSLDDKKRNGWENNRELFVEMLSNAKNGSSVLFRRFINQKVLSESYEDILMSYDYIRTINKYIADRSECQLSLSFKYSDKKIENGIVVTSIEIKIGEHEKLRLEFPDESNKKIYSIHSDILKGDVSSLLQKYNNQLFTILGKNGGNLFKVFRGITIDYEFFDYNNQNFSFLLWSLLLFLHHSLWKLEDAFGEQCINYVSPLRAYPKRYYFLDRSHVSSSLDTLDGDSITELLKQNPELKYRVNSWLKHFNLEINVEALEEIIHKLKVHQNGLNLDITDVGFGISQVLPVIVQGFFAKAKSLTVIEQPEVHLHPKMQADLGDLFIDIALPETKGGKTKRKYSKSLLIETHSEYLLKRIRRRIATGEIDSSEVAIYLVESSKETEGSIITRVDIAKNGNFEWPEEFYGGELLLDTVEFLKAQTK